MLHILTDEVVHPVGRSGDGHTLPADRQRPDLRNQDPRARAPRVAERHREDPDEDTRDPSRGDMRVPRVVEQPSQDGDDDVAAGHDERARDEHRLPADLVDPDDGGNGGEEHAEVETSVN